MTDLPPVLLALGWTLVHFTWQGAAVAAAVGLARRGVRHPSGRHGLACAALVLMALLPCLTLVAVGAGLDPAGSHAAQGVPASAASAPSPLHGAMSWLLGIWAVGVGALALRSTVGWLRLWNLVRHAQPLAPEWQRRVRGLIARAGLRQRVRVLSTRTVAAPVVVGCLRPVVLLPLSVFTGLPVAQLESVILHELAHVKRWDPWVLRLQLIVETLFFYHPAVWWVSRMVQREREFCCDVAVVSWTGDRIGYANALARLETLRAPFLRHILASTGGSLMSRIRRIVQPQTSRSTRWSSAAGSIAALALVAGLLATTGVVGQATAGRTPAWMPTSVAQWNAEFEQAARAHGVDAALLQIVTLLESRGNAEAISPLGAVGLMQIMPSTGVKIAAERGIDGFEPDDLRDPATNIDFGAWYLARQLAEFGDGSLSEETVGRAAAAYNAGPKRMNAHLKDGRPLSEESERYSKRVRQLWGERGLSSSPTLDRLVATRKPR